MYDDTLRGEEGARAEGLVPRISAPLGRELRELPEHAPHGVGARRRVRAVRVALFYEVHAEGYGTELERSRSEQVHSWSARDPDLKTRAVLKNESTLDKKGLLSCTVGIRRPAALRIL